MTQSWADVAGAALLSLFGLATLPQMAVLACAGLLLRPGARNGAASWILSAVLYAFLAARDAGHAWPQLDSLAAAMLDPLPWIAAVLLAAGLWGSRQARDLPRNFVLPLSLLAVAALARPSHDPVSLAQLRGPLGTAGREGMIFLFHFIQGSALAAVLLAAAYVSRRWLDGHEGTRSKLAVGGAALLLLWAASFVTGVHGALCRQWLLRWPPGGF